MEEKPVAVIRESARNLLKLNRRYHREENTDISRDLENLSISPDIIAKIINRLKTKSSMTVSELHTLKNGLMDDSRSIELVLKTHGALRGLVRELIGRDVNKQHAASACICNLALGDSKAGNTIAKAAGPYLIAALDSLTGELAVTNAWALGNLAGSGTKACTLLTAQGAISKLCDLLQSSNEEVVDASLYALVHFTYQMGDEFGAENIIKILESLTNLKMTMASSQLLFIISCHNQFAMADNILKKVLELLPGIIENHSNCTQTALCCPLVFLLRTLANVYADDGNEHRTIIIYHLAKIVGSFKKLLSSNSDVREALLWLLGNIFNSGSDCLFLYEILN